MLRPLIEAWRDRRYLAAQRRQTRAKRAKDAYRRPVPSARLVRERCADLDATAPVLSLDPRNEIELDVLRREAGFTNVTALDVWDFARVARECVRVVRPGGYVFCAPPRGFEPNAHDRRLLFRVRGAA